MPKVSKKDPNKPKGAKNGYNFFLQDQREKTKETKTTLAEFSRASAGKWKNLNEEEKKVYSEKAEEDKQRYKNEMSSYTPPPEQELDKSAGKKKKKRQVKDPNHPKKSLSAYFHFINRERANVKKENPNVGGGAMSKVLGEMWSKMTDEDKAEYQELAKKDRERYDEEMKVFKNGGQKPTIISKEKENTVEAED